MKKFVVVLAVLFSFVFCSIALVATPGKLKVVGKPLNKNWQVKIEKNKMRADEIVFSEDGGKTSFPISSYIPAAAVWSPDHKYLLLICDGLRGAPAHLEGGYWFYGCFMYDPPKRTLFGLTGEVPFKGWQYCGLKWFGSGNDLAMRFFDGNMKEMISEPIETNALEWEKNFSKADRSPYLSWFVNRLKQTMVKGDIAAAKSILGGTSCKPDPIREVDHCKKGLISIMQQAKKWNAPLIQSDLVARSKDFNKYEFNFSYNIRGMYCYVEFIFSISEDDHHKIQIDWSNVSCGG
jgi:hypothetical protein